jgi:tetratricopeptide (TPR) repeat protein
MEVIHNGLRIASTIGHREYLVANQFTLGVLYTELLAPKQALRHLTEARDRAGELGSQLHIHYVTGALAKVLSLLGDLAGAQHCLETVLSRRTPMDTLGNRYCWARRAELALAQDNPALALEITDRLISSAPGMEPGRVVTFLWKLKGEALVAIGRSQEAETLLQTAVENARSAGERFLLWSIHDSLGQVHRAGGCQSAARKEFSIARELVLELANSMPSGRLRDDFVRRAHKRLAASS